MTKNADAADAAKAAPEDASLVDLGDADDELQALAEAAAEGKGAAVATAGTALFVKVLTGSSVAAGAAEKLAGRFGQWLADNPDTRLQASAQAYARADAAQREREAFLAQVRTLLAYGLRSTEAALSRLEQGQDGLGRLVRTSAADLEEPLFQVLRGIADLTSGHARTESALDELRRLLAQVLASVQALGARAQQRTAEEALATPAETETRPLPPRTAGVPTLPRGLERLDFFISYTSSDVHWAEWIAWELEAAGHRVALQKWDFRPGSNFVLSMQEAASKARRTVAVLSPAYFQSGFANAEWAAAFVQDPTGASSTLLPVRVADFTPPGLLRAAVYVDLVGRSEEESQRALLGAVVEGRAKPDSRPGFPGKASSPRTGTPTAPKPVFPGRLPDVWTVPLRENPFFAGRDQELAGLLEELAEDQAGCVVLSGMGGVGKTQLAAAYAYARRLQYDAVLWVEADAGVSLRTGLAGLVEERSLNLPEQAEKDEDKRLRAVERCLRTKPRWLLVLDNVDSEAAQDEALAWLERLGAVGHVLMTSRRQEWPASIARLDVDVWSEEVSTAFLLARTEARRREVGGEAGARALAVALGGIPLALDLAASYVETRKSTFAAYQSWLQTAAKAVLEFKPKTKRDYKHAVASTWWVNEEALGEASRVLLRLSSFLAPAPILRSWLEALTSDLVADALTPTEQTSLARVDEGTWEDALVELSNLSLVELGTSAYSVHRLLAVVQRERVGPDAGTAQTRCARRWLSQVLPEDAGDVRSWPLMEPLEPHLETLVAETTRPLDPEAGEVVPLLAALSGLRQARGQYAKAAPLRERWLAIVEASRGAEHTDTLTARLNLAQTLFSQGDLTGARGHEEAVLEALVRVLGAEHPDTLTARLNLAQTLFSQGDLTGARGHQEAVLEALVRVLGAEHPDTLTARLNLAQTLFSQGDLAGARGHEEAVLEALVRVLGAEHPDTLTARLNLAQTLFSQGDLTGARGHEEAVLEALVRVLGAEHPDTLTARNNLAQTLFSQGDLTGARGHQEAVLEALVRVLGAEHPDTLTARNNLAGTLFSQGDLAGARGHEEAVLEARVRVLGAEHPDTLTARLNLAGTLFSQGDLAGARGHQEAVLEALVRVLGAEHPNTLTARNNLAVILAAQSREAPSGGPVA